MGEPAMELTQSQLQQIAEYVKSQLPDWVHRSEPPNKEIHDRILVVEQELKAQRELMSQGFAAMDKRFEALQQNMDNRFEALQQNMDNRFEAVDGRFEALQLNMDKRFEASDKRFESLQYAMDKRFEAVDKRFETVDKRFSMLQWMWGGGVLIITLLMSLYQFLG